MEEQEQVVLPEEQERQEQSTDDLMQESYEEDDDDENLAGEEEAEEEEEEHSGGTFRLRRSLIVSPNNPNMIRTIKPRGERSWEEVSWSGKGHRRPVNTELGVCCRYLYPGMVRTRSGVMEAARSWHHYDLKEYLDQGTFQTAVWNMFWTKFRLADNQNEDHVKRVFHNAATKVVKDAFSDAWVKDVAVYYKTVLKQNLDNKIAASIHLTTEQYLQSHVDWLCKDPEAWRWLCVYWGSDAFQQVSDRNRGNRKQTPASHTFGADGFVGKAQRMEAETGVEPDFFDVYLAGHKGPDPNNPEILCDEASTDKLTRYIQEVRKTHGPDVVWRRMPLDANAAYVAGGGLPHGRIAIGDGILER